MMWGSRSCAATCLEQPSSHWPDRLQAGPYPRPSVAVVYRHDGGRIGG